MKEQPLKALICGFERGGTTLLTETLRQHPKLKGGFEGGFLLVNNPSEFINYKPYSINFKRGWQVNDNQFKYICKAQDWGELYKRVVECSNIITDKNSWIFDKTPKYMQHLSEVIQKVDNVPCVVLIRDPRAVLYSWAKRVPIGIENWQKTLLKQNCERYLSYAQGWQQAIDKGYEERILLVKYEQLCVNKEIEAKKIFEFIGLDFSPSYLKFNKSLFPNVYDNSISQDYAYEYKKGFSEEINQKILEFTSKINDWGWNYG